MSFDDATLAQIRAANPTASTWVSANAGSGKTRVLTDRVARLLFMGTNPQKILCLTYTKAAAAEMQNRLFERLGAWAMMPDDRLCDALADLGEPRAALTSEKLRNARTLFANALETPGGLKIQTIHSFCDKLLRRFPLEAGVSPLFEVMEDRQAKQLREEVLEDLADGKAIAAVDGLARYLGGTEIDFLLREIVSKRKAATSEIATDVFGVSETDTLAAIAQEILSGPNIELLQRTITLMSGGLATDIKNAKSLGYALKMNNTDQILKALESVFLFKNSKKFGPNSAKIGSVPTKKLRASDPQLAENLDLFMQQVEAARKRRVGVLALARTRALTNFATSFLAEYDLRKSRLGKLDFDDLIAKAGDLLGDSASAQWVLFKLDGGIDHILVDEAQDTSPSQWSVISHLADEFTAGFGARELERTLFVVGDEKQSIYSFQGADPAEFSRMRARFEQRYLQVETRMERQDLLYSFRSADPVLRLVDRVFEGGASQGLEGEIKHRAFKSDMPGRVDLWPFLTVEKSVEEVPWFHPVDTPAPDDPRTILGNQVADWIDHVTTSNQELPGTGRVVKPGDILILVQSRGPLFRAIIKALKTRNVPVAGADRLDIGQELAVRDILSLLKFANLPEDNLSLAEALRSPLLGFSEGQLFSVAHGRKGSLWQQLRKSEDSFPDTLSILHKLLKQADFLRPFELIEMILTEFKGRENLVARLGNEVEDGINELLSQALQYEQVDVPTLAGFLQWFESGSVVIKREMETAANQVRVMTVHGAKGLEAPIVILPDTAKRRPRNSDQIVVHTEGSAIWKTDKDNATDVQLLALEKDKEFEEQERMRLLYVAMTRAERWLVVCGAGDPGKEGESWYNLVEQAMADLPVQSSDDPLMDGEQSLLHKWTYAVLEPEATQKSADPDQPDWVLTAAPIAPRPAQPLSPSKFEGAKALYGDGQDISEEQAMRKGRQIHLLLEHLVGVETSKRAQIAKNILVGDCQPASTDELPQVLAEACKTLDDPRFSHIFSPHSLAEVGITAALPECGGQSIDGIIDRLVITDNSVLAIDFKTNQLVPEKSADIPLGILRQMGAYASALQQIYPLHKIELAILWTATPMLMSVPNELALQALQSITPS